MAIDIREDNFESQVLQKSFQVPVVVDFWADWCGPCKMLGPVLEKLERDFQGGFVLAKVDTEANPNIAMMFRISSIPDVKIVKEGKIVDQFVGALPEKDILKVLNKHVTKPKPSEDSWEVLSETKPKDFLKKLQATAYREQPEDREALLWKAIVAIIQQKGSEEEIRTFLQEMEEDHKSYGNQRRVLLAFLDGGKDSIKDLYLLLKSPNDKLKTLEKYYQIVENTPSKEIQNKKDLLICLFYILPPDDTDVLEFRKKLSRLLF